MALKEQPRLCCMLGTAVSTRQYDRSLFFGIATSNIFWGKVPGDSVQVIGMPPVHPLGKRQSQNYRKTQGPRHYIGSHLTEPHQRHSVPTIHSSRSSRE